MNLKEFLKPTSKKIILFLIFLTLYLGISYFQLFIEFRTILPLHAMLVSNIGESAKDLREATVRGNMTNLTNTALDIAFRVDRLETDYILAVGKRNTEIENSQIYFKPILFLLSLGIELLDIIPFDNPKPIFLLLYWYFLSCFIVWIYSKIKRK